MIYFTSDTHYFHRRIIEYSGRPFKDVEEMNEEMIRRWNERVGPGDTVFHLGDFSFGPASGIPETRARLNGEVHLILGNHDRSRRRMLEFGFEYVEDECITVFPTPEGHVRAFLRHRPPRTDSWRVDADVFLCGHVHEHWARRGDVINVGVDVSNFRPLTLSELLLRDLPPSVPVATPENPG